jgi:hypothetical protein
MGSDKKRHLEKHAFITRATCQLGRIQKDGCKIFGGNYFSQYGRVMWNVSYLISTNEIPAAESCRCNHPI